MITFNNIGYYGMLGNQMFQYACLYAIAKKNGYEFCLPNNTSTVWRQFDQYKSKFVLGDIFEITAKFCDSVEQKYTCNYSSCVFDERVLSIPDSTDIIGYFQSEKYFEHCSNDIRKEFEFKNKEEFNRLKVEMESLPRKIGIHVRRGDYVNKQFCHPLCSLDFYKNGVDILYDKTEDEKIIYIFSDDIKWCKENMPTILKDKNIIFDDETSYEKSLMKMTLCDDFVMANSSYSWWGAWLGNNKTVVAPYNWFSDRPFPEYKDIYAKNWIII